MNTSFKIFVKKSSFKEIFIWGLVVYIILVLLFGIFYHLFDSLTTGNPPVNVNCFWDSIYFSFVSFLTIGYGDIVPTQDSGKIILFFESICSIVYNVTFSAIIAYHLLKRPEDVLISNKIYFRKSKKQGLNNGSNYDLIIRVGNLGSEVVDCVGVLEFFTFSNDIRTTNLKCERTYRVLDKTWNFKMRFFEPGSEERNPQDYKNFLVNFFHDSTISKEIRFSLTGLDNASGQLVSAIRIYKITDIEFIQKFADVYTYNGTIQSPLNWSNFHKSEKMTESEKSKVFQN